MANSFPDKKPEPFQWPPSPRVELWTELERLHVVLGLPVPTATLTIEQLEAEVARLRREAGEE